MVLRYSSISLLFTVGLLLNLGLVALQPREQAGDDTAATSATPTPPQSPSQQTSSPPTSLPLPYTAPPSAPPSAPQHSDASTNPAAPPPPQSSFQEPNYTAALSIAITFLDVQQSGTLPSWNRVRKAVGGFRDNAHTYDGQSLNADLSGGYYDGAHSYKVAMPLAYTVSNLVLVLSAFPKVGYSLNILLGCAGRRSCCAIWCWLRLWLRVAVCCMNCHDMHP
jgi:hypothetical protein